MKKQFKLFILLLIPLILASCGGDSQTPKVSTKLSFNIGQLAITASSGGAMIYGQSVDGSHRFSRRIDTTLEFNIDLPKGAWNFYTLAWTGNEQLSGSALCASNEDVNLTENDTAILIQLNNANCADTTASNFSPLNSSFKKSDNGVEKNYFAQTQVTSCRDIQKFQSSGVKGCNNRFKGHTNSVKIIYPEITQFDNGDLAINFDDLNGLKSKCYNLSNGSQSSDVFSENLPLGNAASSSLFTVIRSYYGSASCDDNEIHGYREIQLENGLAQTESSIEIAAAPSVGKIFHAAIAVSSNDVCDSIDRSA